MKSRNLIPLLGLIAMLGGCAHDNKALTEDAASSAEMLDASLVDANPDFLYLAAQDAARQGQYALAVHFLNALVEQQPDVTETRLQLAQMLMQSGQSGAALPHLKVLLDSINGPEAVQVMYAQALIMQNQPEAALAQLNRILVTSPDNTNAVILKTQLLLQLAMIDMAAETLQTALQHQQTAELYALLGRIRLEQHKDKEAIAAFLKALKLNPDHEQVLLTMIQTQIHDKQRDAAEKNLREFIASHPNAFQSRNALGRMLVESGRAQEAIHLYQSLADDTHGNVDALTALGILYFQNNQFAEAEARFRETLKKSDSDIARFYLGACLEAMQQPEAAIGFYEQISEDAPVYPDAQIRLGAQELAQNETAKAEKRITSLLKKHPQQSDAYMLLSVIDLKLEHYQALVNHSNAALVLPHIPTRLLFNRAIAFEELKQFESAESELKRLLSLEPNNPEALNFLGYLYADQGIKLDEAERLILQALKIRPKDGYFLDSLAWVYFKQQRYTEAAQRQEQALKLIGDDPVMHEHLGDILWKLNRQEDARTNWQKALDTGHENPGMIREKIQHGL